MSDAARTTQAPLLAAARTVLRGPRRALVLAAGVVMAQAFGQPAFPVDTHIHRLAGRWRLSNGTSVERTERDLKRVFPEGAWSKLHLQIIYFGREHCPARGHVAEGCPICHWASAGASARR